MNERTKYDFVYTAEILAWSHTELAIFDFVSFPLLPDAFGKLLGQNDNGKETFIFFLLEVFVVG